MENVDISVDFTGTYCGEDPNTMQDVETIPEILETAAEGE